MKINRQNEISQITITVFIFLLLFNPYSLYITVFILITYSFFLIFEKKSLPTIQKTNIVIFLTSLLLVIIVCFSIISNGVFDNYIFFKYLRVSAYTFLFTLIASVKSIPHKKLFNAVSFSLVFHVILVIAQTIYPELLLFTSEIFGKIENDSANIIETYAMRKPGATNSFDTASILSLSSMILFYIRLKLSGGFYYLIAFFLSFVAALLSSRLGIIFSFIIVLFFISQTFISRISKIIRPFHILFLFAVVAVIFLIYYENQIIDIVLDIQIAMFADNSGYGTTGSYVALTSEHLKPLNVPFEKLIFGLGVDPGSFGTLPSDIGYVKLLYHIGIVGSVIVIVMHFHFLHVFKLKLKLASNSDERGYYLFLTYMILLLLVFNYKSLEIYSRGIGDFMIFAFIILQSSLRRKVNSIKISSS